MQIYGRDSLHTYLGDRVLYRNLAPADASLPGLADLAAELGLPAGRIPRKSEADYARVVERILRVGQAARGGPALRRLLFIGDTRLLDATAFENLCQAGGWPGLAFIGAEDAQPEKRALEECGPQRALWLSNRWTALDDFDQLAAGRGLPVDEATVVVVDLDKTALGARGRNGQVIDRARVRAVEDTVASLLGPAFDPAAFRTAYDLLNQPEFHPFTGDNQDYLAYVCLVLGGGLYQLAWLTAAVRAGQLARFEQFIAQADARQAELPAALQAIHADIYARVQAGDPTPFKAFRRNEYLRTVRAFNCLGDAAPLAERLDQEILITYEVRQAALRWQARGALLFGLSDKPDEAATPTPELAAQGQPPLHRALTHVAGA